ncbi:MAG: hypothetical protein JSU68_12545 [Phycisphaerales bacterium]|nr:MAG: hypothetical protein JSU68_12545 [Phycisphaerales bacterium]
MGVSVLEDTAERIVLLYEVGEFSTDVVDINGEQWTRLLLGSESPIQEVGAPELPNVRRSVIIPDDAEMAVQVLGSEYYEIPNLRIVPSKGPIPRTVNPADVPYTFGEAYAQDAFFPANVAVTGEPYIMRDYRGLLVVVNPFQYNPVLETLRVYTSVTIELANVGPGEINVLDRSTRSGNISLAFHGLYDHHFLNYGLQSRYVPLDESGDLLIICYDAWLTNVAPLVTHKIGRGISTTAVGVSTIGNDPTSIKNYIQSVYDTSDLAFVLLVGDGAQVDTPYASGGSADPTYAKLAGSDNYPDIMVGRFSAETAAQVDTQVERTIEYENVDVWSQTWFWKGTGIASNQGPGDDGEYDNQHMDNIRLDLLAYGYTLVDQIYDPTATASQVTTALNDGRGIINYCGHGSTYSWSSSGFSVSHVNALVNDNMLPFICSVACVNGQFDGYTCFAESWLRATNAGEPTGAIGAYMSSINQSWNSPMCAQDEFVDLFVSETYSTLGTLLYAGSCQMMDEYGSDGVNMFNTWHLFGDPTLRVVWVGPRPPQAMDVYLETPPNMAPTIDLLGSDDGLPDPPAALDYIITALPTNGSLSDPSGGSIASAPYTLTNRGNQVVYTPALNYIGPDAFTFLVDDGGVPPEGGQSAEATVSIEVGGPSPLYQTMLDEDPGWSCEGQWAFGAPTGGGSHNGDPDSGHTGENVYGYNLDGDYPDGMPQHFLTAGPFDCSGATDVELRFWRWLGVEWPFDHAHVAVSNNGTDWTTVWTSAATISDSSWNQMVLDISAAADDQPTVYVRWCMGTSDGSNTYPGWNIDDVGIWGVLPLEGLPGDFDADGNVDLNDFATFANCYHGSAITVPPGSCSQSEFEACDMDDDLDVDLGDFATFANYYTG